MGTARPSFSLLSVAANIERHNLASDDPFVLLMLIQYPGSLSPSSTQQYLRLARNTDPVTFDAGDGLGPQIYAPFNFDLGELQVSTTGAVPEMELKASNVMRVLQGVIEQYSGLVGANLTLFVVNTANPAGESELTLAFTVKQTTCDAKQVSIKLGAASPLRRLFPLLMYRPNYCGWVYNSLELQVQAAANPTWRNPGKACGYQGLTVTGATTAGSPTVTLTTATGVAAAQGIAGPGIPSGTTILSLTGAVATLSANATATEIAASMIVGLATCAHTIDGAAGCKAHFPTTAMRALSFPGIDSNGASAAGVI